MKIECNAMRLLHVQRMLEHVYLLQSAGETSEQ